MEGGNGSSKKPEHLHMLVADDTRAGGKEEVMTGEVKVSQSEESLRLSQGRLILKPLTKIRHDSTQLLKAGNAGPDSVMMHPYQVVASNADDEHNKTMSVDSANKLHHDEDPPDSEVELVTSDEGEKRRESGERAVLDAGYAEESRNEIEEMLTDNSTDQDPDEMQITEKDKEDIRKWYEEDTKEAHRKIKKLIEDRKVSAVKRWQAIHESGDLNFSTFTRDKPNAFIRRIVREEGIITPDSIVMELGPGRGSDARYIARATGAGVMAVDISEAAVRAANRLTRDRRLANRVSITRGDFLEILKGCGGMGINVVYSHSTLHYTPHRILQHEIFPKIAELLGENETLGKLCMAMKLGTSASATSTSQQKLAPGNPYNPSLDERHNIFRIYPHGEAQIHELLNPSFTIDDSRIVSVTGYDRDNEDEDFCEIIATARPEFRKKSK